jgi:hypothetical protein
MIYYRLEISKTKPTQFRITVVDEADTLTCQQLTDTASTHTWINTFATPAELHAALESYLLMEESQGTPE